jgi:hypothetical protein
MNQQIDDTAVFLPVTGNSLNPAVAFFTVINPLGATQADKMGTITANEVKVLLGVTTLKTKLDFITVTGNVNLDNINTRVNDLDAAVILKGSWNPTSGVFPGAGAAQAGWSYLVTADATVDGVEFKNGDRIICILDNGSTSTYAGNWYKADYTDRVNTVQGLTGTVVITDANLSTSDITTNNASITKHGFLKKLSGNSTDYMAGDGNWTALPGGGGGNTFADNVFYVYNNTDNTKQIKYSLGGATTAKVVTIASAHTVDRTITLPDATTTLVGTDATQTLTNKTFGASTVTGAWTVSVSGASSTPAYLFTGSPFSGTTTTAKALVLLEGSGATSSGWVAVGTWLGINANSGFTNTGSLIDAQYNGATRFRVSGRGEVLITSDQSRPISLNGSSAGSCNYYANSSNTSGIVGFQAENHRGSLQAYVHMYVGGNAVTGNIFGLNRQDRVCIVADGSQMSGMLVGTLTSDFLLLGTNNLEAMRIDATQSLVFPSTITPAGTTGAQTIDKISGTVNIATGNSSIVVTNNMCTANSIIMVSVRTNDTTAYIKNVVAAAGSFTINLGANATAEVSIGFFILNK